MPLQLSIQAVIAPPSNNSGGDGGGQGEPATGGSTATSPMGGGRAPSMSNAGQPPQTSPMATGSTNAQGGNAGPHITASTQGVIGIPDLKLETAAQNSTQGSVVSSEKNNVKLEKGTLLLLKVTQ